MDRRLLRACFGVVTLIALAAWTASDVRASCLPQPPIEKAYGEARLVFVGTVLEVRSDRRTATVRVEEVWKGGDLPPTVLVRGGPEEFTTSTDRTFEREARYLFFPTVEGNTITDSACSATQRYTADLDRLRPADARVPPTPAPEPTAAPTRTPTTEADAAMVSAPMLITVAAVGVGVLLLVSLVALARARGRS